MKSEKFIKRAYIIAAILAGAVGTLLHFLYKWTGGSYIVGLFSAVNESVWEHLKLLFIPVFISTVIENLVYGKAIKNFFFSRLVSVIIGLFSIIALHYGYTGAIGKRFDFLDISIYFIALILTYLVSYIMIKKHKEMRGDGALELLSVMLFGALTAMFFIFTYYPPSLPIFIPMGS